MRRFAPLVLLVYWMEVLAANCHAELVELTVVPQQPPDASSVSVFVDASLLGEDEAGSSVSGSLTVDLLPTAVNPTSAHIVTMDLTVDDAVQFQLGGGLLPLVVVSAESDALKLSLLQPGKPGELDAGAFDQFENLIGLSGVVNVSVEPEPIDLGEQDPASVDFQTIQLATDRHEVQLNSALEADVVVPVEVGVLTVDVLVAVDGSMLATGVVPPAVYTWDTTNSGLDHFNFNQPMFWMRGGVANTNSLPDRNDDAVFQPADSTAATTLDLNGTVALTSVAVDGNLRLADGILQLTGDDTSPRLTTKEEGDRLEIAADAQLESVQQLVVGGPGHVVVHGTANELHAMEGHVGGTGTIARLIVGNEATLVSGTDGPLQVATELILDGDLLIEIPADPVFGEFTLVTAAAIDASDLNSVKIVDGAFSASGNQPFHTHLASGLFSTIVVGETAITMNNTQAIAGDTDGNGQVDFDDFVILSTFFGGPGDWPSGDFDGDGSVDFEDFVLLSGNFGQSAIASVPEPGANGSLLWAGVAVATDRIRRRKKKGASNVPIHLAS